MDILPLKCMVSQTFRCMEHVYVGVQSLYTAMANVPIPGIPIMAQAVPCISTYCPPFSDYQIYGILRIWRQIVGRKYYVIQSLEPPLAPRLLPTNTSSYDHFCGQCLIWLMLYYSPTAVARPGQYVLIMGRKMALKSEAIDLMQEDS